MWRFIRIATLLLILIGVAGHTWLDRVATQSWKDTLWVGVFPLNADDSPTVQKYIGSLTAEDFAPIETFFEREAHRFGKTLDQPVRIELYPQSIRLPPALSPDPGPMDVAWWSLKMRWFAMRASKVPGRAPPRVRIFVMYHDPSTLETVPDSHGMQKGLMGVVHAFADRNLGGRNDIVIAHELMHTLGASDKYELGTGAPSFPNGFAAPDRRPLYPQPQAEIMAGRRALSARDFEMPRSLRDVVVGPLTAAEIRWTHD